MAFVVELVFSDDSALRIRKGEAHRGYWKRMAEKGALLGGGPWRDGSGEILLCETRDRAALHQVLHADPFVQSRVVSEVRVREWEAIMGHVILAGMERGVPPQRSDRPRHLDSSGGKRLRSALLPGGNDPDESWNAPAPGFGVEDLTAHERRIALMMVDGMTNRKIADAFSVSTRAVELHITRIYRKLSIKRRAQLAWALHGLDDAVAG